MRAAKTAPSKSELGQTIEREVEQRLLANGLQSIARNFRCRLGEIDLVMSDQGVIVFVEVRFRAVGDFVDAVATITTHKQRKLVRAALTFLQENRHLRNLPCRFDVVGVEGLGAERRFDWIKNAFSA